MEEKEKKECVKNNKDDLKELKEVMETLRDTVPDIIKGIVDALYSSQNAEDFGKQVANFYKSMVDAGMDKEQAFQLTKEFMESRDIAGLLKKMFSEGDWKKWAKSSKNGENVKDTVDEAIKDAMKDINEEK